MWAVSGSSEFAVRPFAGKLVALGDELLLLAALTALFTPALILGPPL